GHRRLPAVALARPVPARQRAYAGGAPHRAGEVRAPVQALIRPVQAWIRDRKCQQTMVSVKAAIADDVLVNVCDAKIRRDEVLRGSFPLSRGDERATDPMGRRSTTGLRGAECGVSSSA